MTQAICDAITQLAGGNGAPFVALLAEDLTWTIRGTTSWSGSQHGRASVLRLLRGVAGLIEGGWRARVDRMIVGNDGTVVVELQGENQLRDGGRYDNQYCWIVRSESGVIREIIEYGDTALIERVLPPLERALPPA